MNVTARRGVLKCVKTSVLGIKKGDEMEEVLRVLAFKLKSVLVKSVCQEVDPLVLKI